jgi:hypothetical protein
MNSSGKEGMETSPETLTTGLEGVQNGSKGVGAVNAANMPKLKAVMSLFRLQNSDLQRHTGFSKAYISGLVAGKVKGSPHFWMKLNSVLPKMINDIGSGCCVFEVQQVEQVQEAK